MINIFETLEMDKCAILATLDGVNIGLLTVALEYGKPRVTYRNEYSEHLEPIVKETLWQYKQNKLMIDANKFYFHLSFIRHLHNKKIREFKENLKRS